MYRLCVDRPLDYSILAANPNCQLAFTVTLMSIANCMPTASILEPDWWFSPSTLDSMVYVIAAISGYAPPVLPNFYTYRLSSSIAAIYLRPIYGHSLIIGHQISEVITQSKKL